MARVQVEQAPRVLPDTRAPNDYENIQASPAAFGGLVGAAEQRTGQQIEQGGNDLVQAAVVRQNRFNQVASDDAFNQLQKGYFNTTFGDPNDPSKPGFYGMRGEAAMRAYPQTTKSLDDLRNQIRNGLQNDAQRLEFDTASRRLQMYTMDSIGRHYDQQFTTYQLAVNEATERNQQQAIGAQWNNDTTFNNSLEELKRAAVRKLQVAYGDNPDPKLVTAEINRVTGEAIEKRAIAWGAHDPSAALGWLKTEESSVDPSRYSVIERQLKGLGEKNEVNSAIERSFQPGPISQAQPAAGRSVSAVWDRMIGAESGGNQFGANGQPLTSPKGATGVAQLMPATARDVAERHGFEYDPEAVQNDRGYNHMLGRAYFGDLVKQYGGNTTLAAAAYNAGPGRVDQWITQFGDPRTGSVSDAAWADRIPIAETRAYVMKTAMPGLGVATSSAPAESASAPAKQPASMAVQQLRNGALTPENFDEIYGKGAAQQYLTPPGAQPDRIVTPGQAAVSGVPAGPLPLAGQTQPQQPPVSPRLAGELQTMQRAYQVTANMEPDMREKVLQGVYLRIQRANTLYDQADAAAQKARRQAAEAAGNRIVTQLLKDPAKVNADEIANDPNLDWHQKLELNRVVQAANAPDEQKDVKTYGPGFWALFQRIHSAEGDPNRITDPSELWKHGGPNGDLTVSGIDKLTSELQGRRTPEGEAASEMKKQFLLNARKQISGTNELLHLKDPKGDELYLKFLAHALPAYDAGIKAGKTPAQMLDPDSKDYLGASIKSFGRPMSEWSKDVIFEGIPAGLPDGKQTAATPKIDLTTRDGIVSAYQSGRITYEQAQQALVARGFARPDAPAAPAASGPQVPATP